MKKFLAKIIISVIIGSLAGGSLFYFWKNKYVFSKDRVMPEESLGDKNKENGILKKEGDKKISDGRAAIINYVEKNINKISPEKPDKGLAWRALKIWFIDDKNFYADYEDEVSTARRLLIHQSIAGPAAEYEILGFFIPGENGWVLKSGKDIGGIASFELYEKNQESNEWVIK